MYTRFRASQSVEIAIAQQPIPIQHYLRQPQRVVNALAASSQIEALSDERYRLKMRPLTFMMLRVQPVVDMRVWAEADGTVRLRSIDCEIRGVEYINQRFGLDLFGRLRPVEHNGLTSLIGQADLEVRVEIPPPLQFTPKSLLEKTGNGLLKSVLLTVKQRLVHQLLSDYYAWVDDRAMMSPTTSAPLLSTDSSLS